MRLPKPPSQLRPSAREAAVQAGMAAALSRLGQARPVLRDLGGAPPPPLLAVLCSELPSDGSPFR